MNTAPLCDVETVSNMEERIRDVIRIYIKTYSDDKGEYDAHAMTALRRVTLDIRKNGTGYMH